MSLLWKRFIDRLAERFAAMSAGTISSRVAGFHAAAQAEQQSELEDLARRYDAEGKPEIAATLRERVRQLTSGNLAAEAAQMMAITCGEAPQTGAPTSHELPALPEFPTLETTNNEPKTRKKAVKQLPGTSENVARAANSQPPKPGETP